MIICSCDGTVNGIFTAIYHAWKIGTSRTRISVSQCEDMELFAEYRYFESEEKTAAKVAHTIRCKLSPEIYSQVCSCALSHEPDRGDAIYRFLIKGFGCGPGIIHHLADPDVMRVFELDRNVGREAHKYLGFIRFGQYTGPGGSFLISRFDPVNNILDPVSHHFADRLSNENWIIADTNRKICSLHSSGSRHYIITDIKEELLDTMIGATRESTDAGTPSRYGSLSNESIEQLWEVFRSSIAIEPRRNEKLQQQLMPLRYRTYMNTYSEPAK